MKRFFAFVTAASLMTAPAAANVREAAFSSSSDRPHVQASMFGGATLKINLSNKGGEPRTQASLGLSGMTSRPGSLTKFSDGVQLVAGPDRKAAFNIGGQDVKRLQHQSNLSAGAAVAIGIGVAVLVAVVAAGGLLKCKDEGNTCD